MASGRRSGLTGISRSNSLHDAILRIRQMELGRLNNTQEVTLASDGVATSTAITIPGVRSTTTAILQEINQAAATARRTGDIWTVCTKDTVTINHPAAATTRTFRVAVFA